MKEKVAIELLKSIMPEIAQKYPTEYVVALISGLLALYKQIPIKPIKKKPICYEKSKNGEEAYAYDYHCPVCKRKVNKEKHHCPCGQALDLSI